MDGEQDPRKIQLAQDLLQRTQASLEQGTIPSTKSVVDTLSSVEQALAKEAKSAPDSRSEKTVSDMAKLVSAAEELISEKDLGDRIQRIAKEAQLAQEEQEHLAGGKTVLPEALAQASHQAKVISDNFGPLFRLTMQSREFRRLVINFLKVSRSVFLRNIDEDELENTAEKKFLEGKSATEIGGDLANKAKNQIQDPHTGKIDITITEDELKILEDDCLALLAVISSDLRYNEGINNLMALGEILYQESDALEQKVEEVANQTHMQKLQQETKDFVAEFTGKQALDRFLHTARVLAKDLKNDHKANAYLTDVKNFIAESSANPTQIKTESFRKRSRELIERGQRLYGQLKYKPNVRKFLNASDSLMDNLKNDEVLANLRQKAGILVEDLTYEDEKGNRHLDTQALGNIQKVIVPVLAEALKYIPIPKITSSTYYHEYSIENIVLCGYDIIPENIFVHLESDSWVSVKELESQKSKTRLIIQLRNFRTEIKDVHFHYKRKIFPSIEDSGRATIRVGGTGATLTMTFFVEQKPGQSTMFTKGTVDFDINQLDIDYERASLNHDIIIPMVTSLFKSDIIKSIEDFVEENLGVVNDIAGKLSDAIMGGDKNKFTKQLDSMMETVKTGKFLQTYQKRQEKLE